METRNEIEQSIIKITSKINTDYPELSKFITEMPNSNSEDEDVNIKSLRDYYKSLKEIIAKYSNTHKEKGMNNLNSKKEDDYADLQIYPPSEDIYRQGKKEEDINPEDISKRKIAVDTSDTMNEKTFADDMSGADLDVPGSELDDQQEKIGSEDEENNYYSIGGDNHNNLEENKD